MCDTEPINCGHSDNHSVNYSVSTFLYVVVGGFGHAAPAEFKATILLGLFYEQI